MNLAAFSRWQAIFGDEYGEKDASLCGGLLCGVVAGAAMKMRGYRRAQSMKVFVFSAVQSLACGVTVPVAQIFEVRVNDHEVVTAVTDDVETENVCCLSKHCSCRLREQSRSDVNCGSRSAFWSRRRVVLTLRRRP